MTSAAGFGCASRALAHSMLRSQAPTCAAAGSSSRICAAAFGKAASPDLVPGAVEAHAADRQHHPANVDGADYEAALRSLCDLLVRRRVVRRLLLVPLADEPAGRGGGRIGSTSVLLVVQRSGMPDSSPKATFALCRTDRVLPELLLLKVASTSISQLARHK